MMMNMGLAQPKRRYSIEEYLRIERDSSIKHEYIDGEILAMAGGSAARSTIILNFNGELRNLLKGKPCRPYESNLRIRIPRTPLYTYPDGFVVSGPLQFDPLDVKRETVVNPRMIAEVLSPTSEAYDRGDKFKYYRQIDSLAEYVLVSQNVPLVETFFRQPDGTWLFSAFSDLTSSVRLSSIEISLPMSEIYADVEFPPPPPDDANPAFLDSHRD
jgi:Uma2 family endonuclease